MSPRDAFLARVKTAVAEGNRAGAAPPLPARDGIGYQGAGADPVDRFCTELANAGGKAYVARDAEAVVRTILGILQPMGIRKIVMSDGGLVNRLELPRKLTELGFLIKSPGTTVPGMDTKDDHFAADVGITNVYRLIAETGSVVVSAHPREPRSISLLPPVHIAIADRSQLLPDLFDLFDLFSPAATPSKMLPPSCLTLITGPSKTGDIELRLVTGVHGPGEVHVILWNG